MNLTNLFKGALALIICVSTLNGISQEATIINKGANIVVGSNAYIIGHHYVNDKGTSNGTIDIDGTISLTGNWTNNADNNIPNYNVFINNTTNIDGTVKLTSANEQTIGGSSATHFENLDMEGGNKKLTVNNNQVNGVLASTGATLELNKNKIIVNNSATNAINFTSGYIKSETGETDKGYGEVEWKIGNATGEYKVPFGTGSGSGSSDLEVVFNAKSMDNANGSVVFATYSTSTPLSSLPLNVAYPYSKREDKIANRYWKVEPIVYSNINYELTFNYTDADISKIKDSKKDKIKMVTYSEDANNSNKWKKMKPIGETSVNSITGKNIKIEDKNKWWTLVDAESKYYVTNVITPNGDGINDLFGVAKPDDEMTDGRKDLGFEGEITSLDAKVFNRWGKVIKKWTGTGDDETIYGDLPGKGVFVGGTWDGKTEGGNIVSDGTYFWVIDIEDDEGTAHKFQGTVNVYSK